MAYTFRRASRAMSLTSSTTAVAFFANFFSPLMPIKSFGVMSGFIVPLNYILVVLMMPPTVILYERYIKPNFTCCTKCDHMCQKFRCYKKMFEKKEGGEMGLVESFCDDKLDRFVNKAKYIIIFISAIWLGVCIW